MRLDGALPSRRRPSLTRRLWLTVAAVLLLLMAGAVSWGLWPAPPAHAGKPSIAVLPFANLGGDDATTRLANGITEDVITDLTRFPELEVVARNSTVVYTGKPADVRQIEKDLGVSFVLMGSIQRSVSASVPPRNWSTPRPARTLVRALGWFRRRDFCTPN